MNNKTTLSVFASEKKANELFISLTDYLESYKDKEQVCSELNKKLNESSKLKEESLHEESFLRDEWEKLFHQGNGKNTPELKKLRMRVTEAKEMAGELDILIENNRVDHANALEDCAQAARRVVDTHREWIRAYAESELINAIESVKPALHRAMKLKYKALSNLTHSELLHGYDNKPDEGVLLAISGLLRPLLNILD